jgi:hypothetical protein
LARQAAAAFEKEIESAELAARICLRDSSGRSDPGIGRLYAFPTIRRSAAAGPSSTTGGNDRDLIRA